MHYLELDRQPRVTGTATQVLGRNLEALVEAARKARDGAGDEYVSSEHLLLALAKDTRFGAGARRACGALGGAPAAGADGVPLRSQG